MMRTVSKGDVGSADSNEVRQERTDASEGHKLGGIMSAMLSSALGDEG